MQLLRTGLNSHTTPTLACTGSRPHRLTARAPWTQRKLPVCSDIVADRQFSVETPPATQVLCELSNPSLEALPVIFPTTAPVDAETATNSISPGINQFSSPAARISSSNIDSAASTSGSNGQCSSHGSAFAGQDLSVIDPDAVNPNYNRSGLNGLKTGSTSGLQTGCFTVTSQMPVQYTITEVQGIFDPNNKALLRGVLPGSFPCALGPEPEVTAGLRRFVVIDENIHRLYGAQIMEYFTHHGVEIRLLPLPTCEQNKELQLVTAIAEALEDFKINRRQEPIIAIGGGVCLDVAGLAANLYRRNTGIIKVPTTVMAVVDAAVGIKTAVNFHEKKNKLGTYQPPLGVLYDTAFLHSLESRHISNGSAEVLKMACIKDAELFGLLEAHAKECISNKFQGPIGASIIRRSIQGMLEELEYNLWEAILVRLVDYGHTVSPELEMAALRCPEMLLHGEAVSVDMALSAELAYGRGLLSAQERLRVLGVMVNLNLPLWHEAANLDLLMKGLKDMTLARDGLQRVPLMKGIGAATFVYDITRDEMGAAIDRLLQFAAAHGDAAAVAAVGQVKLPSNNVVPFPVHPLSGASNTPAGVAAAVDA